MVLADMANPPEHDFAPAWLKIPSHQKSTRPAHVNYTSDSGCKLGLPNGHQDRLRSRHYSTDSNQGHVSSPTHEPFGFRGRDEHRTYFGATFRHHSVDDLPWDPDPTTNWNISQFSGNSNHTYGTVFPRRGSSVPQNSQQYSSNGFTPNRGQFHQGKSNGRQRYNSGPKSGYSEQAEDHRKEANGKSKNEAGVQGDKAEDTGKESDNQSALSNQDFPSLSGSGDDVDPGATSKKNVPTGAWEKPPGTTKIIAGRKLQLVKKSIPSTLDSKPSGRAATSSSIPAGEGSAAVKIGGQLTSTIQNSKLATVTVSSNVVLKSMTSIAPLVSPRTKETPIRTAPVPSSRISPVSNKPSSAASSRSTPVTSTNPPPAYANKTPINKPLISRIAVDSVPFSKAPSPTPTPKPTPASATSPNPLVPIIQDPPATKAKTSANKPSPGSVSSRNNPSSTKPVLTDSSKNGTLSEKPASTSTKPVMANLLNGPSFSLKPKAITNLSITKSTTQTPSKPTSVTNMSSVLLSSRPSTLATSNRTTSSSNRPPVPVNRSAPMFVRPSPMSSSRHSPLTIANRPNAPTAINPIPVSLCSGSVSSSSNKKEKTVSLVRAFTPQSSPKELSSPLPNTPSHPDLPLPSPTTPKPKKGDKLDFLNELRRSNREELPKEISQKNQNNLQKVEEHVTENGPSSAPKTILHKQHEDIKTNGIDIHHDFAAIEKGSKDEEISSLYPVFSPTKESTDMSSSLEAEKRLLQEMGWHEHSDNEEGYAPLTEEELREFQKRSQQLKKNGFTKSLRVPWNSVQLPIGSITQFSLEDGLTSSESDSSDDEPS